MLEAVIGGSWKERCWERKESVVFELSSLWRKEDAKEMSEMFGKGARQEEEENDSL